MKEVKQMFGRKKAKPRLFRGNADSVSRTGKRRVNRAKTGGMQRRYNRQSSKLKKAGFKFGGAKPMNRMNPTELAKMHKKANSGKYDVRTITEPPKWENESPREYVMFRRKS